MAFNAFIPSATIYVQEAPTEAYGFAATLAQNQCLKLSGYRGGKRRRALHISNRHATDSLRLTAQKETPPPDFGATDIISDTSGALKSWHAEIVPDRTFVIESDADFVIENQTAGDITVGVIETFYR